MRRMWTNAQSVLGTGGTAALGLMLSICVSTPAFAVEWDDIPELRGIQQAAVRKRFDGPRYNDLRSCYRRHESRVGVDYWGVLVDVTDEGGSRSTEHGDATPYAKRVFDAWAQAGRLDPDEDIVIVSGIRNRSVGVQAAEKWRKVGFDQAELYALLETTEFRRNLRNQRYPDAMCTLIEAIDERLAALLRERAAAIAAGEARLVEVNAAHSQVLARIEERFDDEPFGKSLRTEMNGAREKLASARQALRDNRSAATPLIDEAATTVEKVRRSLVAYEEDMAALEEVEQQIKELRSELQSRLEAFGPGPGRWADPLRALEGCQAQAAQLRAEYEIEPTVVRDCLNEVRTAVAAHERDELYQEVVIPTILAVGAALALTGFIVARLRRRRRALALLRPDLDDWEHRLDQVEAELAALRESHNSFFENWDGEWEGESAGLDAKVADAVNRAFLLHQEAKAVFSAAAGLVQKSGALDVGKLDAAARALRETAVTLPEGTDPRQPIAKPLRTPYDGRASTLRGDLLDAVRHAEWSLEELGEQLQDTAAQNRHATEAARAAVAALEQRQRLGYPVDHLARPLGEARDALGQAQRSSARNPVGASGALADAANWLEAIRQQAETGNTAVEAVKGPLADQASELQKRIRELRLRNLKAAEPGFDPDSELSDAARSAEWALQHVQDGREDEAATVAADLRTTLDRLDERLDVIAEANDVLPPMLEAVGHRREELKSRILSIRMGLQRADEDYTDTLEELTKLQTVLSRLASTLADLEKKFADQHYLSVAADVRSIVELCDRSTHMVESVADSAGLNLSEAEHDWPTVWYESAIASWVPSAFGSPPSTFGAANSDALW